MPNLTTLAFGAIISSTVATIPSAPDNGCARSGCNGTLCVESGSKPLPTLCRVTAESSCYQYSTCAKDAAGQCGWQSTPTFDLCMRQATGKPDTPSATTPSAPTLDYNKVGPTN